MEITYTEKNGILYPRLSGAGTDVSSHRQVWLYALGIHQRASKRFLRNIIDAVPVEGILVARFISSCTSCQRSTFSRDTVSSSSSDSSSSSSPALF